MNVSHLVDFHILIEDNWEHNINNKETAAQLWTTGIYIVFVGRLAKSLKIPYFYLIVCLSILFSPILSTKKCSLHYAALLYTLYSDTLFVQ